VVSAPGDKTARQNLLVCSENRSCGWCDLLNHPLQRKRHKEDIAMNPFDWWLKIYEMWMDLWFEVNALRNCRNIDKGEIDKIKELLIREGIWK
jgi:hypothetical protein